MLQIRIRRASCSVLALFALGSVVGCASSGPPVYFNPNADFSRIRRVAVMPLSNLTGDRWAGERVRELITVELLAGSPFHVIEPSQVNKALAEASVDQAQAISAEQLLQVAQAVEADGFFMGTILEFQNRRTGNLTHPVISLSLRLVDVSSGQPIWSTQEVNDEISIWTRLFSVGEPSLTGATETVVRDILNTLY